MLCSFLELLCNLVIGKILSLHGLHFLIGLVLKFDEVGLGIL